MSTIHLTPDEEKWVAHLKFVNKGDFSKSYVVLGPDGQKHWVCIFNPEYISNAVMAKKYEMWSPLNNSGGWHYYDYGPDLPAWADPDAPPAPLLVEDGFSLEEIESAEHIMAEL